MRGSGPQSNCEPMPKPPHEAAGWPVAVSRRHMALKPASDGTLSMTLTWSLAPSVTAKL